MFEKKAIECELLREVGIARISYRGTWVYEYSGSIPEGSVILAVYYEVHGDGISTIIRHWGDISLNRTTIDLLISSIKLEEDIHLPNINHGRYLFFSSSKPELSSSRQDMEDALSASRPKWTLALWDEEKQAVYLIKYRT